VSLRGLDGGTTTGLTEKSQKAADYLMPDICFPEEKVWGPTKAAVARNRGRISGQRKVETEG
jgi:hypothetical protein